MIHLPINNSAALMSFVLVIFSAATLHAQPFSVSWFTIDGGGGHSVGGTFELGGTIGQMDAGVMAGGSYELAGGFWVADDNVQEPFETVADSINIFRGLLVGGVLQDTFASDDSRMRFNPGLTLSSSEAPVWLIFDAALPSDNPASLSLVLESQAGTPGLTGTLEAWNWTLAAYDVVDVSGASFNNDTVVTASLNPAIVDYVEAGSGAVRIRVGWRKTGLTINFPWEVRVDQVVWITE